MSFLALSAMRRAAPFAAAAKAAPRAPPRAAPRRLMGSGGGRPWADKQSSYYGHFHVSPWHKHPATIYCTVMWLWMMRAPASRQ